ncbi:MAG: gamma subclass chorismate mutase AroQ [Methylovulum sp.]|nr:gamma subclass chorismate mutase AroQ [Methylovulum sp.]
MSLPFITLTLLGILVALPVPAQQTTPRPASCDVRQTVTSVLALIEERLQLAEDVARYKWNTQGEIEDKRREQAIISHLGQRAIAQGLPVAWAESFFRAQIEASKTVQQAFFADWRLNQASRFDGVPDLAETTRPKLDALTVKLIAALAAASPQLRQCGDAVARLIKENPNTVQPWQAAYAAAIAPLLKFTGQ